MAKARERRGVQAPPFLCPRCRQQKKAGRSPPFFFSEGTLTFLLRRDFLGSDEFDFQQAPGSTRALVRKAARAGLLGWVAVPNSVGPDLVHGHEVGVGIQEDMRGDHIAKAHAHLVHRRLEIVEHRAGLLGHVAEIGGRARRGRRDRGGQGARNIESGIAGRHADAGRDGRHRIGAIDALDLGGRSLEPGGQQDSARHSGQGQGFRAAFHFCSFGWD